MHDKMASMGLEPPSVASLARIFRERDVARREPHKKPRAAFRRFVYPAPNACWQLDATEYVLTRGRKCVIFQLEDDNSRVEVASHVAESENSEDALIVFKKGVEARGVPQRLLTDNGLALNPHRRGWLGKLTKYANSLGVETITSKPYKPTTQGKNERLHGTLFKWLDKQPIAESIEQLQAMIDEFDHYYNNERPHQGLPGRLSPQQAWDATEVAEPPRPTPAPVEPVVPISRSEAAAGARGRPRVTGPGEYLRKVGVGGGVAIRKMNYQIGTDRTGDYVHVIIDDTTITFFDVRNGEVIIEHPIPEPGTRHVSNGKPRGRKPSPKS